MRVKGVRRWTKEGGQPAEQERIVAPMSEGPGTFTAGCLWRAPIHIVYKSAGDCCAGANTGAACSTVAVPHHKRLIARSAQRLAD